MKILAIAHESGFNGGANRSFYTVLCILRGTYQVDIDVIVPKATGEFVDALKKEGIEYACHPYKNDFSVYRNELKDLVKRAYIRHRNLHNYLLAKKVSKDYKTKNYDVVYINTRMSSFGAFLAKDINAPLVCHIREFGNPNAIWGCWTLEMVGKLSRKVIAISTAMNAEISRHIEAEKIVTILNGIDYPSTEKIVDNWNSNTINLLITGRVVEAKGHMDALKALVELRKRGMFNVVLYVAGTVSNNTNGIKYKEELDRFILENSLTENVTFCGEVKDMFSLRKNMAAELMCSVCEPFGRVTVEAMRSGLLVIGSNTGGTLDIISEGQTGLLYEQGNPVSLADKIEWAVNNPDDRIEIQKRSFEYSKQHFTKEENANDIYNVFCEILS